MPPHLPCTSKSRRLRPTGIRHLLPVIAWHWSEALLLHADFSVFYLYTTFFIFFPLLSGRPPTTLEHNRCWPSAWLAKDCPSARLLSLEYAAPASGWEVGGGSGHLRRAAQQVHSKHGMNLVTALARLVACDSRYHQCSACGQPSQCVCMLHGHALGCHWTCKRQSFLCCKAERLILAPAAG